MGFIVAAATAATAIVSGISSYFAGKEIRAKIESGIVAGSKEAANVAKYGIEKTLEKTESIALKALDTSKHCYLLFLMSLIFTAREIIHLTDRTVQIGLGAAIGWVAFSLGTRDVAQDEDSLSFRVSQYLTLLGGVLITIAGIAVICGIAKRREALPQEEVPDMRPAQIIGAEPALRRQHGRGVELNELLDRGSIPKETQVKIGSWPAINAEIDSNLKKFKMEQALIEADLTLQQNVPGTEFSELVSKLSIPKETQEQIDNRTAINDEIDSNLKNLRMKKK